MVLPLAVVTQRFLQFAPTVLIMLVFLIASGNRPQLQWLMILPIFAMYFMFNAGLALVTARLCVHWRDLNNLLPVLTRFVFYTTGIFFSVEHKFGATAHHAGHPTIVRVSDYQPIHEFLSLVRSALLRGPSYDFDLNYWIYAGAWSFGILAFGSWFFWRAEERYGRVD
jgi:teichoic acid transport system permease protein